MGLSDHRVIDRLREEYHELPPWAVDGALALAVAVAEVSSLWLADTAVVALPGYEGPTLRAVALALLGSLPLAWRRVAPTPVFVVIGAAGILSAALPVPLQLWGLLIAVYSVAAHDRRARALAALAAAAAGTLLSLLLLDAVGFLALDLAVLLAAWGLGDRQQTRRAYTRELELRAAQLEREREDKARLAVAEERGRIARELHDVVAHSVSVMVVQATAARRFLRRDADRSEDALEQVEATGRQSLVELRRLLGLLRADQADADYAPQPRLAEVDSLAEQFRDAGLRVEVTVAGTPRPVSSGVDLSAYRIVQEALTNTLKHAGAASVSVRLAYGDDTLDVDVRDVAGVEASRAAAPAGSGDGVPPGHGLVGMRERAALVGGSLDVGPQPDGGYRVHARLPLEAEGGLRPPATPQGERGACGPPATPQGE